MSVFEIRVIMSINILISHLLEFSLWQMLTKARNFPILKACVVSKTNIVLILVCVFLSPSESVVFFFFNIITMKLSCEVPDHLFVSLFMGCFLKLLMM